MFRIFKTKALAVFLAIIHLVFAAGCSSDKLTSRTENLNCPSVNFLSVGQGDSAFIIFPDGKTMLIDCGESDEENFNTISKYVDAAGGMIDFLVLSHTDIDHTGGAADIINKYGVQKAYVPSILDKSLYSAFDEAMSALELCGAEIVVSAVGERYFGEDYFFCFLFPSLIDYDNVNYDEPTANHLNSISSIIYVEFSGVKFLFTGDATKASEEKVIEQEKDGLYYAFGNNDFEITLEDIDFLKVSHHGGRDEISSEFYSYLCPGNAVISVGAGNIYGHPSNYTLKALYDAAPDINILRTDVLGSISVQVIGNGGYKIVSDAD